MKREIGIGVGLAALIGLFVWQAGPKPDPDPAWVSCEVWGESKLLSVMSTGPCRFVGLVGARKFRYVEHTRNTDSYGEWIDLPEAEVVSVTDANLDRWSTVVAVAGVNPDGDYVLIKLGADQKVLLSQASEDRLVARILEALQRRDDAPRIRAWRP